jgi:hypothetical protein
MTLFITFIYNRGEIESTVNFLFLPIKLCWCVCFVYENALRVHRSATDQECVCVCVCVVGWKLITASANPLLIWSNDPEIVEGDALRESRLLVVVANLISATLTCPEKL